MYPSFFSITYWATTLFASEPSHEFVASTIVGLPLDRFVERAGDAHRHAMAPSADDRDGDWRAATAARPILRPIIVTLLRGSGISGWGVLSCCRSRAAVWGSTG